VGEVLASRGFAGAFGIDVVLPKGGGVPVLIEINPRWTASLALQVELQARKDMPTLLDAHLAAFAYRPDERPTIDELVAAYGDQEDATCTRRQLDGSTVIAYNSSGRDSFVDPAFEPGVWRVIHTDDGGIDIVRARDGWRYADLETEDELLVLTTGHVRPVQHGSYLARVVRQGPAASSARANELLDDVAAIMDAVLAKVVDPI
jgi:hypothetical protein